MIDFLLILGYQSKIIIVMFIKNDTVYLMPNSYELTEIIITE